MAQKVTVTLVDDLDGGTALSLVSTVWLTRLICRRVTLGSCVTRWLTMSATLGRRAGVARLQVQFVGPVAVVGHQ
jgi:hypothetical protein